MERGKGVDCSSSDLPCKKHPLASPIGVCAYCLKDRLIKLVCSECGGHGSYSCSCSAIAYRPNSSNVEVGSVGRISFLIENEKTESGCWVPKERVAEELEEATVLNRSRRIHVEVIKNVGFRRIIKLFRKKTNKTEDEFDDESDIYMSDCMGVSRSRSLSSLRGRPFKDLEEVSEFAFSRAKISDVNRGFLLKSRSISESNKLFKESGISEHDYPFRIPNLSVFPVKEHDVFTIDDSAFIDLKLDESSESVTDLSVPRICDFARPASVLGSLRNSVSFKGQPEAKFSFKGLKKDDFLKGGGSCRVTVTDSEMKSPSKGLKVWRWIFSRQSGRSADQMDEACMLRTRNA